MKKIILLILLVVSCWITTAGQTITNVGFTNNRDGGINYHVLRSAISCPGGELWVNFQYARFQCPDTRFKVDLIQTSGTPTVVSSYTVGMDNVEGIPWSMVGVTVPATAVIGSLYKVRVSSMRPEGCTKDPVSVTGNTVEIRIKSVEGHSIGYLLPPYSGTPKPGPLNISTGQTFRLYAIPERSYYTYTWLLPCPPLCNELAGTRSGVFESTATEPGSFTATLYGYFADAYYCDAPVVSTVINVSGSASNGLRVGTEESAGQEGLLVRAWPNPVREVLTVEVQAELRKPVTISITDARGRLIQRRQTVMEAPKQQELFSLNGQPTGIYLLRVTTADKAQVIKIIKDDK